jgi:DNA-directed RNA polymerase subunit alpha
VLIFTHKAQNEIKKMSILAFQKPDKVIMLESTNTFGRFEFRPLEPGYGMTVGNALRRVLLSSLEGYAITSVKIEGVEHEFASIPGVLEDMVEIILNLKQVRLKKVAEGIDTEKVKIKIGGQTEFKAEQMSGSMVAFKVLNPELVICHMEPNVKLDIEFTINKGRGYVSADENRSEDAELNTIAIDSIYTPIKNVKYAVEDYRVEQKTDYEKLVFEITTDGSIHPKEVLKEAAKILIHHFMLFSDEKITLDTEEKFTNDDFDEEVLHMRQLLKTKLTDLDLSVRALNCLKTAEVETLGELVKFQRNDLLKFRNFGKKSLTELDEKLAQLSLNFGMDVSKYKLDKE